MMPKTDILHNLRMLRVELGKRYVDINMMQALEDAITVLSSETCQDCISREEVMKYKKRIPKTGKMDRWRGRDVVTVYMLEQLPSVKPEEARE